MPSNAPATSQTKPDVTTEPGRDPAGPPMPQMVGVDALLAHPGNVREDLDLTQEFCASVAEIGVRIPLLITAADGGGYRVIEGHRRLSAAVKAGLAEVPCVLDPERAGDQAGQFLDMVIANSAAQRKNFTPVQEAIALFAAHEAGATRTRIRRATGRKADDIKTALQAGGLSDETRAKTGELTRQLTLDELALLAEFDDDKTAIDRIMEALRHGYTVAYVAERIRQDRAEEAEHQRLRAELEATGIHVTDELPDGAARLVLLTHDGEDLTEDNHAACPGRGRSSLPGIGCTPSITARTRPSTVTRSALCCCHAPARAATARSPRRPFLTLPMIRPLTRTASWSSRETRLGPPPARSASSGSSNCSPGEPHRGRFPASSPSSC
jgi:ParB-like chromosome segregation protein Spo0J